MTTYYLYYDADGNEHCIQLQDVRNDKKPDETVHATALRHLEKMLLNALPQDLTSFDEVSKALGKPVRVTDDKNVYESKVDLERLKQKTQLDEQVIKDAIVDAVRATSVFPVARYLNSFEHYDYAMLQRQAIEKDEKFSKTALKVGESVWQYCDIYLPDDSKNQTIRCDSLSKEMRMLLTDESGRAIAGVNVHFSSHDEDNFPHIFRFFTEFITRDGEIHIVGPDTPLGNRLITETEKYCQANKEQLRKEFLLEKERIEAMLPPWILPNPQAVYEFTDTNGRHCKKPLLTCHPNEVTQFVRALLLKQIHFDDLEGALEKPLAVTDGHWVYLAQVKDPIVHCDSNSDLNLILKVLSQPIHFEIARVEREIPLTKSIPFDRDWDSAILYGDFLPEEQKQQQGLSR